MARYGLTWDACMATIYAWKLENIAMGDDTYKLPSSEELYWMRKGWMDERRRMREGR